VADPPLTKKTLPKAAMKAKENGSRILEAMRPI
jgi:hypothetical protein